MYKGHSSLLSLWLFFSHSLSLIRLFLLISLSPPLDLHFSFMIPFLPPLLATCDEPCEAQVMPVMASNAVPYVA
jgi:hypothetical protein